MGRIALFVLLVGGAAYLIIELVAERVLGVAIHPVVSISLAVILAVVLWTLLVWRFGDRLGGGVDDNGAGDS